MTFLKIYFASLVFIQVEDMMISGIFRILNWNTQFILFHSFLCARAMCNHFLLVTSKCDCNQIARKRIQTWIRFPSKWWKRMNIFFSIILSSLPVCPFARLFVCSFQFHSKNNQEIYDRTASKSSERLSLPNN